jgi:hypothetical protein
VRRALTPGGRRCHGSRACWRRSAARPPSASASWPRRTSGCGSRSKSPQGHAPPRRDDQAPAWSRHRAGGSADSVAARFIHSWLWRASLVRPRTNETPYSTARASARSSCCAGELNSAPDPPGDSYRFADRTFFQICEREGTEGAALIRAAGPRSGRAAPLRFHVPGHLSFRGPGRRPAAEVRIGNAHGQPDDPGLHREFRRPAPARAQGTLQSAHLICQVLANVGRYSAFDVYQARGRHPAVYGELALPRTPPTRVFEKPVCP